LSATGPRGSRTSISRVMSPRRTTSGRHLARPAQCVRRMYPWSRPWCRLRRRSSSAQARLGTAERRLIPNDRPIPRQWNGRVRDNRGRASVRTVLRRLRSRYRSATAPGHRSAPPRSGCRHSAQRRGSLTVPAPVRRDQHPARQCAPGADAHRAGPNPAAPSGRHRGQPDEPGAGPARFDPRLRRALRVRHARRARAARRDAAHTSRRADTGGLPGPRVCGARRGDPRERLGALRQRGRRGDRHSLRSRALRPVRGAGARVGRGPSSAARANSRSGSRSTWVRASTGCRSR
jgi:hypothetical protein